MREEYTFLCFILLNHKKQEDKRLERKKINFRRIFLRERVEVLRRAEGSEKRASSTEDQATSPQPNAHLTRGLQGGTQCTVGHVLGVPHG